MAEESRPARRQKKKNSQAGLGGCPSSPGCPASRRDTSCQDLADLDEITGRPREPTTQESSEGHCGGPGTNTVPTKTVLFFFVWWFWIVCVSLGELRSVQSVSATVNLMHSYCARLLIVPQVALFSNFPTGVFHSSATSERKGLISHLFPPPNPTTSKQKTNNAMATQVGFDVTCKRAKTTNVTSCTHVGVRPSGQLNPCAMTKETRPDPGTHSSLRLFSQTHHRAH